MIKRTPDVSVRPLYYRTPFEGTYAKRYIRLLSAISIDWYFAARMIIPKEGKQPKAVVNTPANTSKSRLRARIKFLLLLQTIKESRTSVRSRLLLQ